MCPRFLINFWAQGPLLGLGRPGYPCCLAIHYPLPLGHTMPLSHPLPIATWPCVSAAWTPVAAWRPAAAALRQRVIRGMPMASVTRKKKSRNHMAPGIPMGPIWAPGLFLSQGPILTIFSDRGPLWASFPNGFGSILGLGPILGWAGLGPCLGWIGVGLVSTYLLPSFGSTCLLPLVAHPLLPPVALSRCSHPLLPM